VSRHMLNDIIFIVDAWVCNINIVFKYVME
jgi:hypothetical protein